MSVILELNGIHKSFKAGAVLSDISLHLHPGEILSIVGENGAGKSTLGKIIAGHLTADKGTIKFAGKERAFLKPADALEAGIVLVHQEVCLAENLTIAQNLQLGREHTRMGFIVNSELPIAATMFLEKLGSRFTLTRRVDTLSIAEKQLVEVARALSCNAKIIIFDEPTASLSEHESKLLLSALQTLRNERCSIVYISHRLPEVLQISDRIYGLRDGSNSGTLLREEFSRDAIVQLMIGRQLREFFPYRERKLGEVALELRRFCATNQHQPLDLSLRQGEIVAIAGLVGSGRSELLEAIYGVRAAHSGSLHLSGTELKCNYPGLGLAAGLRLVPESRKEHGLALDMSIQDSIASTSLLAEKTRIWRNQETEKATASYIISRFGINCSSPNQRLGLLSGGNQQKVVLARCLLGAAQVLLLDEPTRGVDLGAKSDIYKILFELAAEGSAILFVSSELEEIMGIADRAIVLAHGRRTGELLRSEFSENALIELAAKNQEYLI